MSKEEITESADADFEEYLFKPAVLANGVIDYTNIEHNKIFLVNKKDILTKPRPQWIPEFDLEGLKSDHFLPACIQDDENNYYVSTKVVTGYNEKVKNDYNKTVVKIPVFTDKTYKMTLAGLVATVDYYIKWKRAYNKANNIDEQVSLPRSSHSMTEDRYKRIVNLIPYLGLEDTDFLTKIYPHRNRSEFHIRQNQLVFNSYNQLKDKFKNKKIDMDLQKTDYINAHSKGEETSYGQTNLSDSLYDKYGVMIKKQNGRSFSSEEIIKIENTLKDIFDYYGNLKNSFSNYNLTYSYADNVCQHARKAIGLFTPYYNAIGVSFFNAGNGLERSDFASLIFAHETAHYLDAEAGKEHSHYFASDKEGTPEYKIAETFKKTMLSHRNGKALSDYWKRTCECFARAFEEDYAITHDIAPNLFEEKGYLPKDVFIEKVQPLVSEYKSILKEKLMQVTQVAHINNINLENKNEEKVMDKELEKQISKPLSSRNKIWFVNAGYTVKNMLDFLAERNMADFSLEKKENGQLYIQGYDNGMKTRGRMKILDNEVQYLFDSMTKKNSRDYLKERYFEFTGKELGNSMTENTAISYFIKDTAEYEMFASFEPITGLTENEAVEKFIEMKNKNYDCGIGINIPGDIVFDDPEGLGAIIFEAIPEVSKFSFYIGDSFVKGLNEKNKHAENVISAFKKLDSAIRNSGIYTDGLYDEPVFLYEKEKELGINSNPNKLKNAGWNDNDIAFASRENKPTFVNQPDVRIFLTYDEHPDYRYELDPSNTDYELGQYTPKTNDFKLHVTIESAGIDVCYYSSVAGFDIDLVKTRKELADNGSFRQVLYDTNEALKEAEISSSDIFYTPYEEVESIIDTLRTPVNEPQITKDYNNYESFKAVYHNYYDELYNSHDWLTLEKERIAIRDFDYLMGKDSDFKVLVSRFAKERGDFFSSDRECAAVVLSLRDLGMKLAVSPENEQNCNDVRIWNKIKATSRADFHELTKLMKEAGYEIEKHVCIYRNSIVGDEYFIVHDKNSSEYKILTAHDDIHRGKKGIFFEDINQTFKNTDDALESLVNIFRENQIINDKSKVEVWYDDPEQNLFTENDIKILTKLGFQPDEEYIEKGFDKKFGDQWIKKVEGLSVIVFPERTTDNKQSYSYCPFVYDKEGHLVANDNTKTQKDFPSLMGALLSIASRSPELADSKEKAFPEKVINSIQLVQFMSESDKEFYLHPDKDSAKLPFVIEMKRAIEFEQNFDSSIQQSYFKDLDEDKQSEIIDYLWMQGDLELRESWENQLRKNNEEVNPLPKVDYDFAREYLKDWDATEYIKEMEKNKLIFNTFSELYPNNPQRAMELIEKFQVALETSDFRKLESLLCFESEAEKITELYEQIESVVLPKEKLEKIIYLSEHLPEDKVPAMFRYKSSEQALEYTFSSESLSKKEEISDYFLEHQNQKERTDYLKKLYGFSSHGQLGYNVTHDGKGTHLEVLINGKLENISYKWNEVVKTIETMIEKDSFFTKEEKKELELQNERDRFYAAQADIRNTVQNFVLDKLAKAGIEVVTNNNEFNSILNTEQLIQKMSIPFAKLNIGMVEDWQIQEAAQNGIDIKGYKHQITNEFIAHVIKNHGNSITEKMRGNIAITETDLKAIRDLISSPDRIVYGTKFKDLVSNKMIDRDIIIYAKNMPDGTSLYLEEILDGKKNTSLRAKTLYKKDKLISDEALLNIIGSNTSRMNTSNSKIIAHEGVAVSPLIQHNNTGAVAISATHEQLNNDISDFVDKSITNYVNSKIQTYTVNSKTYGFIHNDKIYLNSELMNSEVAIHEYTHIWDRYTKNTNKPLWEKGKEIFKQTYLWEEVRNNPDYKDIADDEDLVLSECHARITGKIATEILEKIAANAGEDLTNAVINWDKEVFEYCQKEFGLESKELSEFISMTMKDFMNETKITQNISKSVEKSNSTSSLTADEKKNTLDAISLYKDRELKTVQADNISLFKDFEFDFSKPITWHNADRTSLIYADTRITQEMAESLYKMAGMESAYNPDMAYCIQYRCSSTNKANLVYLCKVDPMAEITSPQPDVKLPDELVKRVMKGVEDGIIKHKEQHHNLPGYLYEATGIAAPERNIKRHQTGRKPVPEQKEIKQETSSIDFGVTSKGKLKIKAKENYTIDNSMRDKLRDIGYKYDSFSQSWTCNNTPEAQKATLDVMKESFPLDFENYVNNQSNKITEAIESKKAEQPVSLDNIDNSANKLWENIRNLMDQDVKGSNSFNGKPYGAFVYLYKNANMIERRNIEKLLPPKTVRDPATGTSRPLSQDEYAKQVNNLIWTKTYPERFMQQNSPDKQVLKDKDDNNPSIS